MVILVLYLLTVVGFFIKGREGRGMRDWGPLVTDSDNKIQKILKYIQLSMHRPKKVNGVT